MSTKTPTRWPNGLTNVNKTDTLGMYGLPDPFTYHTFFEDFDKYTAADWAVTLIGTTPTVGLTAVNGGALLLTVSSSDNDSIQLQRNPATFTLAAGKKAFFKARFKVSDATQSDLIIGLNVIDTTLMGATAGDGNTDGIFFSKDDGVATLDFQCQKDATTGQTRKTAIATLADNTFVTVGWFYDGIAEVHCFINEVDVGSLVASSAFLPDTILSPSFGVMNGEAAAKTMTIDYVLAAVER